MLSDNIDDMGLSEDVQMEYELLKAIYLDDVKVVKLDGSQGSDQVDKVYVDIHPATADNKAVQHVRFLLSITVNQNYPSIPPLFEVTKPRGLNDEQLKQLTQILTDTCSSMPGGLVLHALIEAARDYLTAENKPSEECAVCLCNFATCIEEDIVKTQPCYHFFHRSCFSRYVIHSLAEIEREKIEAVENKLHLLGNMEEKHVLCPVCRCCIDNNISEYVQENTTEDSGPPFVYEPDNITRQTQAWCERVYKKQLSVGGLINTSCDINNGEDVLNISALTAAVSISECERTSNSEPTVESNIGTDTRMGTSHQSGSLHKVQSEPRLCHDHERISGLAATSNISSFHCQQPSQPKELKNGESKDKFAGSGTGKSLPNNVHCRPAPAQCPSYNGTVNDGVSPKSRAKNAGSIGKNRRYGHSAHGRNSWSNERVAGEQNWYGNYQHNVKTSLYSQSKQNDQIKSAHSDRPQGKHVRYGNRQKDSRSSIDEQSGAYAHQPGPSKPALAYAESKPAEWKANHFLKNAETSASYNGNDQLYKEPIKKGQSRNRNRRGYRSKPTDSGSTCGQMTEGRHDGAENAVSAASGAKWSASSQGDRMRYMDDGFS